MKANIELYNQISKVIFRQRALIAHAQTVKDICYYAAATEGFLTGLALSKTISFSDRDTYMKDIYKFSEVCEELINEGNISRYGSANNKSVLCGQM